MVPGIIITFSGNSKAGLVTSGDEGQYSLVLSEDTYEIYLRRRINPELYKRAKFKLRCANQPIDLNIYIYPHRVSWGDTSPEPRFFAFGNLWFSDPEMNIVISYMKKKRKQGKTIYFHTTLSYDDYNFKAEKMTLDFEKKEISVEGPGWMEQGKDRKPISNAIISFNEDGFTIK